VITIYQLIDPRDGSVRWIGLTSNLKARTVEHLHGGKRSNPSKQAWVAELKAAGLYPIVEVIEEVDNKAAQERELHWLRFYQLEGEPLLNQSEIITSAKRAGRRSTNLEYARKWKEYYLDGGPRPFCNKYEMKKHLPKIHLLYRLLKEDGLIMTNRRSIGNEQSTGQALQINGTQD